MRVNKTDNFLDCYAIMSSDGAAQEESLSASIQSDLDITSQIRVFPKAHVINIFPF